MSATFDVAFTADFYDASGKSKYEDIGLSVLDGQRHMAHRVLAEHRKQIGSELRDHTLGVIGLGGIARNVIELLRGFGMNQPLAFDPFVTPEAAANLGVKLVSLDELLRQSDFVSLHCPLNEKTRGLIG